MNKTELRKQLRSLRSAFPPLKRSIAARKLALQLHACGFFIRRAKLAFYLANDGEINTQPAIKLARKFACKIYLPVVESNKTLSFHRFGLLGPLRNNQYGIQEAFSITIPAEELDVIFMPLVGFDRHGNRLGMGGGYYDRTLARIRHRHKRPLLVGLAYGEQEVQTLQADDWDVQLDSVVTENEVLIF